MQKFVEFATQQGVSVRKYIRTTRNCVVVDCPKEGWLIPTDKTLWGVHYDESCSELYVDKNMILSIGEINCVHPHNSEAASTQRIVHGVMSMYGY